MITIDDLRDDGTKSGYRHVVRCEESGDRAGRRTTFQARVGWHPVPDNHRPLWRGTRRATAEEAARDAADKLNDQAPAPRRAQYTPGVYDVTDPDTGRKITATEDEETKRPSSADGPTAVYVVAFVNRHTHPRRPGNVVSVKVGTTFRKNRSKYALTMGLDVREIITPIVLPSREEAESVALKLEVAFDASPRFERQGAECFAPVLDASFKFTSLLATKAMRDVLADVRDEHASVA